MTQPLALTPRPARNDLGGDDWVNLSGALRTVQNLIVQVRPPDGIVTEAAHRLE